MTAYDKTKKELNDHPRVWLVTGVAGFIGSNLLETLLTLNQTVVGVDNFSTGCRSNLDEVRGLVGKGQWDSFRFIEGDICSLDSCRDVCKDVDIVLHQAAMGSVPRSIKHPVSTNDNNVNGTLNMLVAARDNKVRRFVFASSSSVYGDHSESPKTENRTGRPLSPYAVTKLVDELYADQFAAHYGLETIGLRYFNVFGPRQNPRGPYAAVIPVWIAAMLEGLPVCINGTGETSRDFCYVDNAIQMNILAGTVGESSALNRVYNVALDARTTLNELFSLLRNRLESDFEYLRNAKPIYREFREGDILHSQADISQAVRLTGYAPTHNVSQGLDETLRWHLDARG